MPGSKLGGQRAAKTNKELFGEDWFVRIGQEGGKAYHSQPRGFAANKPLARICGTLGGRMSTRGKGLISPEDKAKYRKQFQRNYEKLMKIHQQAQATSPEARA